ncbi:MAG: molybdopterin molybdotransferase MoeA [Thermoleophilaceae bacterium]|nr:molybdopterin molybdotransferase MoeA [Thermoleophilaceae bacterium]
MSESSESTIARDATIEAAMQLSTELADSVGVEVIAAEAAHGRILAKRLDADSEYPRFANSAMDGWALRADGLQREFTLVGESRAGLPFADSLQVGNAIRISTGAELPNGADCIVPVEAGREIEDQLVVNALPVGGDFVRRAGRHKRPGDELVAAGRSLGAGELATIAAFGISQVAVRRAPRVALIGGGDELLSPGDPLVAGAVYDSNTPMLSALMRGAGCELDAHRYVTDDRAAVRELLGAAAEEVDFVVTSGGISVGEHDHVAGAIDELGGELLLAGTAARPGRRFAIATLPVKSRRVTVFCLPGNPLASWVCFQLYVRRHIRQMLGQAQPIRFEAELTEAVSRAEGRSRILLGRTSTTLGARSFKPRKTESDDVTAIAGCNALATIGSGGSVAHNGLFVECEKVDV